MKGLIVEGENKFEKELEMVRNMEKEGKKIYLYKDLGNFGDTIASSIV